MPHRLTSENERQSEGVVHVREGSSCDRPRGLYQADSPRRPATLRADMGYNGPVDGGRRARLGGDLVLARVRRLAAPDRLGGCRAEGVSIPSLADDRRASGAWGRASATANSRRFGSSDDGSLEPRPYSVEQRVVGTAVPITTAPAEPSRRVPQLGCPSCDEGMHAPPAAARGWPSTSSKRRGPVRARSASSSAAGRSGNDGVLADPERYLMPTAPVPGNLGHGDGR